MTTNYTSNESKGFVTLLKELLTNPSISSVEYRVLAILANMPEPNPQTKYLSTQMREGTCAIQNAVNRLKKKGYLVRRDIRNANGHFMSVEWDLNLNPGPD